MIGRDELERALAEVSAVNGELSPAPGASAAEGQLLALGLDPVSVFQVAERAALANVRAPFLRDDQEAVEEWMAQASGIFAVGVAVGVRALRVAGR